MPVVVGLAFLCGLGSLFLFMAAENPKAGAVDALFPAALAMMLAYFVS